MQPYNVEIFERDYSLVQHYNADQIEYDYDYLDEIENTVIMPYSEDVKRGQYIRLDNGKRNYFGVISGLDVGSVAEGYTEVRYKPFLSMFAALVMIEVGWQGGMSLENMIAKIITDYWISNTDTVANVPGLRVSTMSQTTDWTFFIEPDQRGLNKAVVDFKADIIHRALTKYQVGLYTTMNVRDHTIDIKIGKRETGIFRIEADLPSVVDRKIILNSTTVDTNKLTVFSTVDLVTSITYYKHTDGTYDTVNANRIVPVIATIQTAMPSAEDPLSVLAKKAADKMFDAATYNNLIEIEVTNEDALVLPAMLTFGQIVDVITKGAIYPSIMTGVRVGDTTRLIFGTVRVELTKRLRRVIKNG